MTLMAQQDGFLGLEDQNADLPKVRVIPFGLEASVSFVGGTAVGPAAAITASHQVELFDDELWCEPTDTFALETLEEPDYPDDDIPAALDVLEGEVTAALDAGAFPLVLGGEHSLTPGALRPFIERYEDLALVHFDAHADLRDGYEGEHFSHAAAIRRCMDAENLDVHSLFIRNISAEEIPFLEANKHRLDVYWSRDRGTWDLSKMYEKIAGRPVYVTFDIDCFDSSLIPATGTPEPGGPLWDEVMPILRKVFAESNVVGADVVELSPSPGLHACDFLTAKLIYKMLAYKFAK